MYYLTRQTGRRIRRAVQAYEAGKLSPGYQGSPRPLPGPVETWIGYTSTYVPGISGSTPGTATVALYSLNAGVMTSQGLNVTVANLGGGISSGQYVLLQRDPVSGTFVVDDDGCCYSSSSSSSSSGGAPTVTNSCCSNPIPETLYATLGTCSTTCYTPQTITLTWVPVSGWWAGSTTFYNSCLAYNETVTLHLYCSYNGSIGGYAYTLSYSCNLPLGGSSTSNWTWSFPPTSSCSPVDFIFSIIGGVAGCCQNSDGSEYTIEVTE